MFSDSIVVITRVVHGDTTTYLQSLINGVSLEFVDGSQYANEKGVSTSELHAYVKYGFTSTETYIPPKEYSRLAISEKERHITFMPNQLVIASSDYIDMGLYPDLESIRNNIDSVYLLVEVEDFNKVVPHFKLICK